MCAYDPDLKANFRDIPRPSQWKLAKLQMWLDDNPVADDGERAFLLAAVDERIGASARAEAEKASVVSALFNKKWVGKANSSTHSCTRCRGSSPRFVKISNGPNTNSEYSNLLN